MAKGFRKRALETKATALAALLMTGLDDQIGQLLR